MALTEEARRNIEGTLLILLPTGPLPSRIKQLQSNYPQLKIEWHSTSQNGHSISIQDLPADLFAQATHLLTYTQLPTSTTSAPHLRFIQLSSAGYEHCTTNPFFRNPAITLCTANGCHPPQIAEWVIGVWLAHQHHFERYRAHMRGGFWEPPYADGTEVQDSTGLRVGIFGYGSIGRQCGRLAHALGMQVFAYTARERATPTSRIDDSYCVPGTGDPAGLIPEAWFHGKSQKSINNFLSQNLDILVLCLPLTPSTEHILSSEQFEILSRTKRAFVANVGRGRHINQDALVHALEAGWIRGAALDVTDPEPLPPEHRLWEAPNLFITPHVSWKTSGYWGRVLDILDVNLQRLAEGRPLMNTVEKNKPA